MNNAIPKAPGIYLFKDKDNLVIYIGKAKSLRDRVNSYFHNYAHDWKVTSLVQDHTSIEFILTTDEHEALLLEAQLIKEHKPKYNVLLKTGQPFVYLLFTKKDLPTIKLVRNKREKGIYFGPFLHKSSARAAYHFLMETFKLNVCNKKIPNGCLDFHIGRCAGTCMTGFSMDDYHFRLSLAQEALKNSQKDFMGMVKEKIGVHNKSFEFEQSKRLHYYLENIEVIFNTLKLKFTETKYQNEVFMATTPGPRTTPQSATVLQELLGLDHPVITVDCFDISHFQSSYIVGSCVRFTYGNPDKQQFRHFRIKTLEQQNDYAALQEIVSRRYRDPLNIPDLVVIDGGKGQLSAARAVLPNATIVSLAKREETIFSDRLPEGLRIDVKTEGGKLLIALRDYAHHFAISYHRKVRSKNSTH